MNTHSPRSADPFHTAIVTGQSATSSALSTGDELPVAQAEWSLIRPLTNFGRALRLLANEAIDATRGRYDR